METNEAFNFIYKVTDWIMKLAYLNFLWIVFTLLGLGIFGFMPSFIAMFTIIRKWLMKEEVSTGSLFWKTYKKEFIKGNILFFIILTIASFLYFNRVIIDLYFYGTFHLILSLVFYVFVFVFIITFLYIIPVYVHYKLKFYLYLTVPILIAFSNPILTLLMLLGVVLIYMLIKSIPAIIPFFGMVLFAIVIMSLAYKNFQSIQHKRDQVVQ